MRLILRLIRKFRSNRRKKGESVFSYAVVALVLLLALSRMPAAFTKTNPILALPLALLIIFGALWLASALDSQLDQLPLAPVFRKWTEFCTNYPDSRIAVLSPYISIAVYSPLLVIPFVLHSGNRELIIPVACMGYAVVAYCLEAFTKYLILKQFSRSR